MLGVFITKNKPKTSLEEEMLIVIIF